ncbi:M20/M25/M40 family metallo-hydrolase [Lutispora thermophila]|uniref:Arginine utilization protein RocB n=1 Tax=Lutispora thermophila DSM 19022 TaxID=1122184 RepID=A0A1M6BSS1_9FIRM|nr:M20/M25/M40 family metallo-hydrolase [Lutispora thermophila]SHI51822.1 Arginine utilization protein RocB [Lutispora thermophila DSM 19022]
MQEEILKDIEKEIEDIFYSMVKVKSDTNTVYEKNMEGFYRQLFDSIEYFKQRPDDYGFYPVDKDPLGRNVFWALVKGTGKDTIILINHYDVVDVEDFKTLKSCAFSPKELERELLLIKKDLPQDAREDLDSGDYIFGRGTADMKGGAAIQLALLKRYAKMKNLKGNMLYLSVPDEENLSAGMRSAVGLIDELRQKFDLEYMLMINSEPHQRVKKDTGIISEGSVGKIMPFIYVRGYLSHAGKVFEGLNPVSLLTRIVSKTELNLELSDFIEGEASPPPTWLHIKDGKTHYDVSMPLSAYGYMSLLTLDKDPVVVINAIRKICMEAFSELIDHMNMKYEKFCHNINRTYEPLPWKPKVLTYKELYDEANENYPDVFIRKYDEALAEAGRKVVTGQKSMADVNFDLVERIFDFIDDLSPRVVIGLAPPYYPNVSNFNIENLDIRIKNISCDIAKYAMEEFQQPYERECFFTGISDLSYTYIKNGQEIAENLKGNMPLYGSIYSIPFDKIEKSSMPCINIGPWGKDLHKLTERVLKEDLFYRTPKILNHVISSLIL